MVRRRGGAARATYIPAGTPIEVRTADPGLNGAWHPATVARPRPRRTNYEVDYAAVGLSLPRTVPANLVRPRPPPAPAGASVNDLVEAFREEGWWIGVVSAVGNGGDRYTVSFPGSREVAEFGRSEIRPYREWRRGRWFALANQVLLVEAIFGEGAQVEVSADNDNYGAHWLTGTVVKVIAKTIYLVEYKKPTGDGSHELSREFLDAQYVRPVSPARNERFSPLDEIEVCYSGVWMKGVISKTVGLKYIVKLRHGKEEEEMEFSHSELRRLRTWVNGQWVFTTKRRGRPPAGKNPDLHLSVSSSSSSTIERNDATTLKRKMSGQNSEGQGEALPPNKELKKEDPSDQLWMEADPKTPAFDKEAHVQDFASPPSQFVIGSLQVEAGLQENLLFDGLGVEKNTSKYSSTSEMVATDEEPSNSTQSLSKSLNINHSLSAHEIGNITLPTQSEKSTGDLGPRFTVTKRRKKLVVRERRSPEVSDVTDVRQHSNAETKKRRGRPPKESTSSIKSMTVACTISEEPKGTSDRVVECKEGSKGVLIDVSNDIRSPSHDEEVMMGKISPSPVDFEDVLQNDANNTKQVGVVAAQDSTPRVTSFAQNGTSASFLTESFQELSQNNDETDKNHNSNTLPTKRTDVAEMVLTDPADTTSSLVEALPFVKSSSLWGSIESLEVFQIMPQEPHFRALEQQYLKELREGMAIGLMVTFANLEADVRKLDVSDSQAGFEERLEALKHLEENGFDVQRLRSRICEMLEMKNSLEEFWNKKVTLKELMFGKEYEKDRIDTEKYVVDKTITEVEQHLASLLQKRDSLVMRKINDESKIADLQKNMQATQEECLSAEQRFRDLAASPW